MRRMRTGALVMVLAIAAAGCGGSGVQEGPASFTPTDTSNLQPMIKEMQQAAKTKDYLKKPAADSSEKEKGKEKEKAKKG